MPTVNLMNIRKLSLAVFKGYTKSSRQALKALHVQT